MVVGVGDVERARAVGDQALREAEARGARLAVVDVPLLFETGYNYGFDRIATTSAPEEKLRERALARPGMTVEKLDTILARQLPQAEKRARADYVLETGGTLAETRDAVAALVESLTEGTR